MMGWRKNAHCVLTFRSKGRDSVHCHDKWPHVFHTLQIGTANDMCQYEYLPRRMNDNIIIEWEECSGTRSVNMLETRLRTVWAVKDAPYQGLSTYWWKTDWDGEGSDGSLGAA